MQRPRAACILHDACHNAGFRRWRSKVDHGIPTITAATYRGKSRQGLPAPSNTGCLATHKKRRTSSACDRNALRRVKSACTTSPKQTSRWRMSRCLLPLSAISISKDSQAADNTDKCLYLPYRRRLTANAPNCGINGKTAMKRSHTMGMLSQNVFIQTDPHIVILRLIAKGKQTECNNINDA